MFLISFRFKLTEMILVWKSRSAGVLQSKHIQKMETKTDTIKRSRCYQKNCIQRSKRAKKHSLEELGSVWEMIYRWCLYGKEWQSEEKIDH